MNKHPSPLSFADWDGITRRNFLQRAALLAASGALGGFASSITRAQAIEPAAGSKYLDAEHIVILMQENRSFDHAFGTLRGVRGFDDPRAIRLLDGTPVWAQPNSSGARFLPHRMNIRDSRATWMGSLPHTWSDQVDARNGGRYDRWLAVKQSGDHDYAAMPLTMGYYTRADIPFYYALADAFTVCDQYFCSSLTGTTPNRLHLWAGTIRARQSTDSPALTYNADVDFGHWASYPTFPERLEDLGVSWKVYQNEVSVESGLQGEHDAWLGNFGDNPLECFTQYNVRFAKTHRDFSNRRIAELPAEIAAAQASLAHADAASRASLEKRLNNLRQTLDRLLSESEQFNEAKWNGLSARDRRLHERAFDTNSGDPDYRELIQMQYNDGAAARTLEVPKGDILRNFRNDVEHGSLPTVSWLVPPERVSDHPASAWYGAWYLSEVLDILTKNPEVWRKTIFILTYDENDGYFDHVPPFVAPDPRRAETGRVSAGIDATLEHVTIDQDRVLHGEHARESPIGLGYRVPFIVASPWSRGGFVCSQVFDHTSVIQFLERYLSHKTGKPVFEPNINSWRRGICGDLSSVFGSGHDASIPLEPIRRDEFVAQIHQAKFRDPPGGFSALTDEQLNALRRDPRSVATMPRQESGQRPSRALPYELYVTDTLADDRSTLTLHFEAGRSLFGDRAAGAAFVLYSRSGPFVCRNYAVKAGESIEDAWKLSELPEGSYDFWVYGPNGFFRQFTGKATDQPLSIAFESIRTGAAAKQIELKLTSPNAEVMVTLRDRSYGNGEQTVRIAAGASETVAQSVESSHGWYDFEIVVPGTAYSRRFGGRVETGLDSYSDPLIGRAV